MPRGAWWVLVAGVCLALPGCGGGAKTAARYRIAVIPKGLTHEHWQSVHRGADGAVVDLNAQGIPIEVVFEGPLKESDALEQIGIVDRFLGAGIQGIALAPQHSEQMVAPVERAVAKKVPVVIIDSDLARRDLYLKYVATDNYNGGKLAAEHLLKTLKDQGKPAPKLVLLRYAPGSESTEQREKGFLDAIAKAKAEQEKAGQPTLTLVDDKEYAHATADTAEQASGPLLTRHGGDKGIDGIFAVNESATMGMLRALRSQGLNKKILLMGFDSSEPLLQGLRDDEIIGLIVQDPYRMGYLSTWLLVQHLEGHDVSPDGNKVLSTGEYLVTKANLDEVKTKELFTPELQRKRKIETPPVKKRG